MLNGIKSVFGRMFGGDEAKAVEFSQAWYDALFTGGATAKSGANVSTTTALQVPAFYRAVMVIADGIAQLPVELHKETNGGIEPAKDHPLYLLTTFRPNSWQSASEWVRTTIIHAVATGNAVSYRNEDASGRLRELIPVRPENAYIDVNNAMMEPYYDLTMESGQSFNRLPRSKVFHLRAPSWDSFRGLDPVSVGREAIGLARITEESQARMHSNGLKPSGIFTVEGRPTPEQLEIVRTAIRKFNGGVENDGNALLLPAAVKFQDAQMKGVDAEHLDTRKHQIEELGRLLGVFTIMLGHAGDQTPTFASADAFFDGHVRYTLQPWLETLTSALNTQLLTESEWLEGYRFRIDTSELLRGSLESRTEYYKAALGSNGSPGWLTPDEVRADDGWNPKGLDTVFAPVGMVPSGEIPVETSQEEAPAKPDDDESESEEI